MRHDTLAIVRAGIRAADARALTARALDDERGRGSAERPLYILAAGKAAEAMAAAVVEQFPNIRGLIVAPGGTSTHDGRFERIAGGHPVPTLGSEDAGRRALALARSLGPDDHLLILLSGGASALMAAPADGLTLDDKRTATGTLLRAGADIHALNTVRKHLSAIKGGQLAAATRAACDVLVISDVVGDDLSIIASGPTVPDASRFSDALDILRRFGGEGAYPRAVVARLRDGAAGHVAETPKPGDARFERVRTRVIGSRRDAMDGAIREASTRGYSVVRIDDAIVGEARTAATSHLRAVLALADGIRRPACIVSSGETTVHVKGGGRGGRNQEFVLAAAELIRGGTGIGREGTGIGSYTDRSPSPPDRSPSPITVASAGTDGVDGPTDAAGAYADTTTVDRALTAGLPPDRFLADNNSYAFFDALGDLIHTGPTGTNVGDLQVILLA